MHHVTERLLELKKYALIYGGFNEDLQGGKKKGFLRLSLKASKGGTGFQCLKEVDALSFLWLCKEKRLVGCCSS